MPVIRTENAQIVAYIFVDTRESDFGGYVSRAQRAVRDSVTFPPGYEVIWSGQFEFLERAKARLQLVVPVTLVLIFVLLYLNFGRITETLIVMLIYLDHALQDIARERRAEDRPLTRAGLHAAIMEGAVERVRPKMMTVSAIMAGLLPILWISGTGSEVMRRIAVPMIGGMVSSTVLTLIVIPALFALVHGRGLSATR